MFDSRETAGRTRRAVALVVALVAALGALVLARSVSAQERTVPEHPMMTDRFFIGAGAQWTDSNVQASLNSTGTLGLGSVIDFEDNVGLDETNIVGLFMLSMRLSERWRIEIEYSKLDRDKEKQTMRTIDWGDLNIPVNTVTRATFNVEDARISVGYSFFRTKDKEVGIGLGAHYARIEAGLSTANFGSQFAKESAPLPVITLYAKVALTDRWLLGVRADRLSLDTGDIKGDVFSSALQFVYQPWRHFNIGFGYGITNFQLESISEDWRGKAQIEGHGPGLFIGTTF